MSQTTTTFPAEPSDAMLARTARGKLVAAASTIWDHVLGRKMSLRLERIILPTLRWNQEVYATWLMKYVNETTRWLDAGCGHRLLPPDFEILERSLIHKARLAIGIDVDACSLKSHKTLPSRLCGSLDSLPFPDGAFDLVTCNMVVEHLPDPANTFRELGRVLRPGGVLLVHTPNVWNYAVSMARVIKAVVPRKLVLKLINWSEERKTEDIFPTFYRANSRTAIRRQLGHIGFDCERCEMLVGPQPILRSLAPVALCELLLMRATMLRPLTPFATTMLISFRRQEAAGC